MFFYNVVLQVMWLCLPQVNLEYWICAQDKNWQLHEPKEKGCAKFPQLWDLHFNNLYWQKAEVADATYYLYGAYLDRRKNNRPGPTINILSVAEPAKPNSRAVCQIWFEGEDQPVIASVADFIDISGQKAYLSCRVLICRVIILYHTL